MEKIRILLDKIFIAFLNQDAYQRYLRNKGVKIGKGCIIDKTANFGNEPWLISIGNNVRITRNVQFITHDGGLWTLRKNGMIDDKLVKYGKIEIGDNCNISWNVVVMPGVKIAKNCIVAVGAIVTKDTCENQVVAGVPARCIESIDEYCDKVVKSENLFLTNGASRKKLREIVKF